MAPSDNLVRAHVGYDGASIRASDEGNGRTLFGHFAVFDSWTRIDSYFEGTFLERIGQGAFADTIRSKGESVKVLYDHGADPQLGNKPLGKISSLREDGTGAYYEVDLIDTSYNRDFIIPAARSGLLGASFRFRVTGESWDDHPEPSDYNPEALPERTISGVELYEFGPVTFPAYADATAGVRSGTDRFLENIAKDELFVARLIARVGPQVVQRIVDELPPAGTTRTSVEQPSAGRTEPTPEKGGGDTTTATADGGEEWKDPRREWIAAHFYTS